MRATTPIKENKWDEDGNISILLIPARTLGDLFYIHVTIPRVINENSEVSGYQRG